MIVSGEEHTRLRFVVEMLYHCSRNRQAIVGAGTSADLIQDDEAVLCRVMQNRRGLLHLDHEGTLAGCNIVFGTNTRENAVHQPYACLACGNEAADLG